MAGGAIGTLARFVVSSAIMTRLSSRFPFGTFVVNISGGQMSVDTGTIIQGPPIGTDTTGQGQDGPHCT